MVLPDFLICGAPKAGTTALHWYLSEHPDVVMSAPKEAWFFCYDPRGAGRDKYSNGLQWYSETFFDGDGSEQVVGESTPLYMSYPLSPKRIKINLPEAKLLFVLRDPVDRAYSQYLRHVNRGVVSPRTSFGNWMRSTKKWDMREEGVPEIKRGLYHEQLLRYEEHFEAEQMKVILYERFRDEQEQVLREVCKFIGVDPSFEPDTSTRHNVTRYPKSRTLYRLAYALWESIEERLGATVLEKTRWLRSAVRNQLFQSGTDQEKPPMKPQDRAYLQDLYREPNARLEEYLGRDLSHWT